jgi:hypothetical protein
MGVKGRGASFFLLIVSLLPPGGPLLEDPERFDRRAVSGLNSLELDHVPDLRRTHRRENGLDGPLALGSYRTW